MTCSICAHKNREKIEQACLLRTYGDTEITLRDIAKEFDVDLKDLQVHVLTHIPLYEMTSSAAETTESIASTIKRKEADILKSVMEESFITFKNTGDKINTIISQHSSDNITITQITKPLTDLYLGTSQAIRDTADKIMKMNLMVNGEEDKGLSSLANLVNILRSDQ